MGTYPSQIPALHCLPSPSCNLQAGAVISGSRSRSRSRRSRSREAKQIKVSIATVHVGPGQDLGLPLLNPSESLPISIFFLYGHYQDHTPGKEKALLSNATGILLASVSLLISWFACLVKGLHHSITSVLREILSRSINSETREDWLGHLVAALSCATGQPEVI